MQAKLNILFATDFSASSRAAFETIKLLKDAYNLDLSFIHVLKSSWPEWNETEFYQIEALQRLESWQKEFGHENNSKKLYIEKGNAAENIIQIANNIKKVLILLGGKVSENTGRYKTGTTVESVVRNAKQSVWIGKSSSLSKIICGVDGSSISAKALLKAIELSKIFAAKLSVISVVSSLESNPLKLSDKKTAKNEVKFRKKITQSIHDFLKDFDFSGLEVKYHYPWGIPANVILDMAEDFNFDLIIVGSRGHSMLHNVLIGSTAEKILRYTPCSLLVVR